MVTNCPGADSGYSEAAGQQRTFTLVQNRWVRVNLAPTSSVHLIKIPALPSRQGKNSVAAFCERGASTQAVGRARRGHRAPGAITPPARLEDRKAGAKLKPAECGFRSRCHLCSRAAVGSGQEAHLWQHDPPLAGCIAGREHLCQSHRGAVSYEKIA